MRPLLKKLEASFPSAIHIRAFGRSEGLVVEVDNRRFVEVAAWIRMEESFRMDFLECLTIAEIKSKFQFSYFLRSHAQDKRLVLRTFVPVPAAHELAEFPTMGGVWTQAVPFESELAPLFGILFVGGTDRGAVRKDFGKYDGFPLRKSFTWGKAVMP